MRSIYHAAVALALATGTTMGTGAVATAQEPATPCGWAASACVDLSAQQAWLMDNGQVTYGPTPITSGRPGEETPTGRFTVQWKDRDHLSREFDNAPMPYSVFFTNTGVAFHEGSLQSQSAGCVRLGHDAAVRFFDNLAVGEEVQVMS